MRFLYILLPVFFLLFSCFRNEGDSYTVTLDKIDNQVSTKGISDKHGLPIQYEKLELTLGKDFVPVDYRRKNLDNDSDEEFVIAYKSAGETNLKVVFFDFLKTGTLQKIFEFISLITDNDSYQITTSNLFYEDDMNVIIEGKSGDGDNLLYIINSSNNQMGVVGEFKSRYSNIIEFENFQTKDSSYTLLKEVITLSSSYTAANSFIQEKSTYRWDPSIKGFSLHSTSTITTGANTPVDRSVYETAQSFMSFVRGVWYPEKYMSMIKSKELDKYTFKSHNIEFISFSPDADLFCIKSTDYYNEYPISKLTKIWTEQAGLRLTIDYNDDFNPFRNLTNVDVFIVSPNKIQVKGPGQFDIEFYVRFDKHFIEYVDEASSNNIKQILKKNLETMAGKYTNRAGLLLQIDSGGSFVITKDNITYSGLIVPEYINNRMVINLTFTEDADPLKHKKFIVNTSDPTVLGLVKLHFDGLTFKLDENYFFDFFRI